jgi:hypothetical protein
VDARWRSERNPANGTATLWLQHQKNGPSGGALRFEFELHEFGLRTGTADCLVARLIGEGTATPPDKAKKLGPNERMVLDALHATLCDQGTDPLQVRDIPPNVKVARVAQWRDAAMRYLPQSEDKRRREAFERTLKTLVAKRLVLHVDGYVWVARSHGSHEVARGSCDHGQGAGSHGSHGSRASIDARPMRPRPRCRRKGW